MSEQYRKNVQALCDRLGFPNPIREEDLIVWDVYFRVGDKEVAVMGTPWNRAGRLFLQDQLNFIGKFSNFVEVRKSDRKKAADFFAENWLDAEEKGRQMLIAFKRATGVRIHWK